MRFFITLFKAALLISFLIPLNVLAQGGGVSGPTANSSELAFNHWQLWRSSDAAKPNSTVVGSPYLAEGWHSALFLIRNHDDTLVKVSKVKVNLLDFTFDVKIKDETKVLDGSHVKQFVIQSENGGDRTFVNSRYIDGTGADKGFYELLHDGKTALYKRHYTVVISPDYNPVLMSGNKETRIAVKKDLYMKVGNSFVLLNNKKSLKKALAKAFKNINTKELDKKYNLDSDNEAGLIALLQELNRSATQN